MDFVKLLSAEIMYGSLYSVDYRILLMKLDSLGNVFLRSVFFPLKNKGRKHAEEKANAVKGSKREEMSLPPYLPSS